MQNENEKTYPKLPAMKTGTRGKCPRCGEGKIFNGFLTVAPGCESCGLDYSFADPADGPAFFIQMLFCIPVVIFVLWFEVKIEPPLWAHLLTTVPMILLTCVLPLRPLKGWLIASQFFFKAEEGRLVKEDD
ncbi:DUF983 domain-containing protein [Kiloniella sp.]|uniref:DUF983 domain-containing protein n=1 Tax=Kiloniella sp. TaxID=1938587 RepID=UPI003B02320F